MLTKTMRIGSKRTSIKLEEKFWKYLNAIASHRHVNLSTLVNEVSASARESPNLASTLRTFALSHLLNRAETLQERARMHKMDLLVDIVKSWPIPAIVVDSDKRIIISNDAFSQWLRVDRELICGKQIDHIMDLVKNDISDLWGGISNGQLQHATCEAALVSFDGVRRTQAMIIALNGYDAYLGQQPLSAIMLGTPIHSSPYHRPRNF